MNTIYESKNDYMIVNPSEYKTCPVWGYQVYYKHDCDKAHNQPTACRLDFWQGR